MLKRKLQGDKPCVLHRYHSPITVLNEEHHPFPQEWQKILWGRVRDHRTVSVCATGHNTIHYAINYYADHGKMPWWCRGKTREMVCEAFSRRSEALAATAA